MSDKQKCNKYLYLTVLQSLYDDGETRIWGDECFYDTNDREQMKSLREDLKSYRDACPDMQFRVIRRRELNTQYF